MTGEQRMIAITMSASGEQCMIIVSTPTAVAGESFAKGVKANGNSLLKAKLTDSA